MTSDDAATARAPLGRFHQVPRILAPFATDPAHSRGRRRLEPESLTRTPFQRDRDRIVHSAAFRRLAHKTQVFVHHEGDHFRTRLTHTIEVAQIARAFARAFALDEDLAEAVALAHDLGHTPFGHTGEDALDACMAEHGGFDHNAHGLRLVSELESRYADFDGLNLTFETLEGLVKHNGPLLTPEGAPTARYAARGVPEPILAYDRISPLRLHLRASLEAQAAAAADDVAYNAHDLDDGLRAGLFEIEDVRAVPFVASLIDDIERRHPGLERQRFIHEMSRGVITRFIEDAIAEGERRLVQSRVGAGRDVLHAERDMIAFSETVARADIDLKAFLFAHMYRHPEVARVRAAADGIVRRIFEAFTARPETMPPEWRRRADFGRERAAADYIAGMTDRYAVAAHRRIFDDAPDLR